MPLTGYVLINGIVWLLCATIWIGTKQGWTSSVLPTIERPGTASLLLFVAGAFLVASVYDYVFDGVTLRFRQRAMDRQSAGPGES